VTCEKMLSEAWVFACFIYLIYLNSYLPPVLRKTISEPPDSVPVAG
jgi:hypothetical protein